MEKSMFEQISQKLDLSGSARSSEIYAQTQEFIRLLELKCPKLTSIVGDYGKIVLCTDLATEVLGIPFDLEQGVRISGLRRTGYHNYKRTFEKYLDIRKPKNIKELCVNLGLTDLSKDANEILEMYKSKLREQNAYDGADFTHPQYSAMAIYLACKKLNGKISNVKFRNLSNLKRTQWTNLENRFLKVINFSNTNSKLTDWNKHNKNDKIMQNNDNLEKENNLIRKEISEKDEEDYEIWKERMLDFARSLINTESNNIGN